MPTGQALSRGRPHGIGFADSFLVPGECPSGQWEQTVNLPALCLRGFEPLPTRSAAKPEMSVMMETPTVVDSTVAYLGPAGTHSQLAAIDILGPADRHGFRYYPGRSLSAVLSAVADGRAGWGGVPYFDTTSGPIRAICPSVIDVEQGLLAELDILACFNKRITHDLVGTGHLQGIRRVYSKREALDQCRAILATTLPHAKTFEESSTVEAVHRAEREGLAIASRLLMAFHLR